jgi:hypothetical protein
VARSLLHAQALSLPHPSGRSALLLEAPLPEDLAALFRKVACSPPAGALPGA